MSKFFHLVSTTCTMVGVFGILYLGSMFLMHYLSGEAKVIGSGDPVLMVGALLFVPFLLLVFLVSLVVTLAGMILNQPESGKTDDGVKWRVWW